MHYVENIPSDIDMTKNYYIDFNICGSKIRYKLDFENATMQSDANASYVQKIATLNKEMNIDKSITTTKSKVGDNRNEKKQKE